MEQVKTGDTVKVHYHGRLTDGTTFDTSEGRGPLEFTVGDQQVIKGFDDGVLGMSIGEKKTIHISAEDAYGSASEDKLIAFPRAQFPPDMNPEVGMQLSLRSQDGQDFPVVVSEIREDVVVLDANHPLAGRDLVFDVEVVGIN